MHTRRDFLRTAGAGAALMMSGSAAAARSVGPHRLMIGTIERDGDSTTGIYAAEFHDGVLSAPLLAAAAPSPGFLAVAADGHPVLFACIGPEHKHGDAATFTLPRAADAKRHETLRSISVEETGDVGGCHVGVSRDGRSVFVANYTGGSITSFTATPEGVLKRASFIQFPPDEHGPMAARQEKSHAHSAVTSPGGNHVLVNDLGLDRIHVFRLNHATAELTPHGHWASAPGAGPRHLALHPNGKWIYCINELNNTVDQLLWNAGDGTLRTMATVSTLPADEATPGAHACEVVFSKDMRFLYASNRTYEGFAVFTLDAATGAPRPIQHIANPGRESRHLAIDPSGKWFLSANQFSGDVSVFPIDTATGKLGERSSSVKLGGASCLLFA